ncbi:hypothetical protein MLD38_020225 [Melastoma candidum]|uniref:Uncharacterized protein n=1 Tax=Melastoma candidum TaxID=119954 RepID=A0ACB9QKA0_9MYRT|nr:hypothetical protein MLD38_020225 [Melastoma candidum]
MDPHGNSSVATTGTRSPCGACKFLRRKCAVDCIFAPYFSSDQGPARFAAVHKVFGASNVSKLLMHLPVADRCEAVVTIAYEAQARIRDPVYGCVAHIFALQQQVAYLQAQLMNVRALLPAQNFTSSGRNFTDTGRYSLKNFASLKSSLDHHSHDLDVLAGEIRVPSVGEGGDVNDYSSKSQNHHHHHHKTDPNNCDLGELHSLAFRMMRN